MKNYHYKKNSCRVLSQFFRYSLVGCMDFVSIKNKQKGMRKIAKEFQDGNKSDD